MIVQRLMGIYVIAVGLWMLYPLFVLWPALAPALARWFTAPAHNQVVLASTLIIDSLAGAGLVAVGIALIVRADRAPSS